MDLFRLIFYPVVIIASAVGVRHQMKRDNITFWELLRRKRKRLLIALVFILFSIGYGAYKIWSIGG